MKSIFGIDWVVSRGLYGVRPRGHRDFYTPAEGHWVLEFECWTVEFHRVPKPHRPKLVRVGGTTHWLLAIATFAAVEVAPPGEGYGIMFAALWAAFWLLEGKGGTRC